MAVPTPSRRPLRATAVGVGHGVVAAAATAGVIAVLGAPPDAGVLVRASGIVALVWAYAGLVLGLLIGIRPIRPARTRSPGASRPVVSPPIRPARTRSPATDRSVVMRPIRPARARSSGIGRSLVLTLHRQLDLVVIALTLAHALSFALLAPGGSLLTAFVPGVPGPQSLGFTLGALALYLALILGPSYYLRDRIGRRTWLIAHQLAAFSYALALWHSLGMGADLLLPGVGRTLTWVLQLPLIALIGLRLFRPRRPADQLSAALRRGRYEGRRHALLRGFMATGLIGSAVFVLVMALVAGTTGQQVTR